MDRAKLSTRKIGSCSLEKINKKINIGTGKECTYVLGVDSTQEKTAHRVKSITKGKDCIQFKVYNRWKGLYTGQDL
jgi:hypothetical protein